MAANDPVVDEIIADCKRNMQLYCDTYNPRFKIATSYVKVDDAIDDEIDDNYALFFVGKRTLFSGKHPYGYSIATGSRQQNINFLDIEKGLFLTKIYDSINKDNHIEVKSTTETVDGPLMIAVKINDTYHFVGLAVVGVENKIGVFSIIKSLSNEDLKTELLDAVKEGSHMLCFKDENSFFIDGKFKPGINTNERGHAATEIRRLKKEIRCLEEEIKRLEWIEEIRQSEEPCASKKHQIKAQETINAIKKTQVKAQKRINAIDEALKENSPEKLHTLLEKKGSSFWTFFSCLDSKNKKSNLDEKMVYRSLPKKT